MISSYVLKNTFLKGKLSNVIMIRLILINSALVRVHRLQNPGD